MAKQIAGGQTTICGVMIERTLVFGAQKLGDDPGKLKYGVSITDECVGLDETGQMLARLADAAAKRESSR